MNKAGLCKRFNSKAAVKTFCCFEVLSWTVQTLLHASGKGWRCLCEFYIKLLGCVIANWLMLLRCGQLGGVSALKMFRVVRNRTAEFFYSFWFGEAATNECLRQIEANPYEKTRYELS
ncbi:hypothetical protein FACS189419_01510 [Planctomycetales bacterium]|nr:hypothetical protein FACS189419_01510 [Planctomycetales bacterium]